MFNTHAGGPTADPSSGLHGYTHEHVDMLTEQQEREVLVKSIEAVIKFTGKPPKGWTAPSWRTSSRSIKLLEEFGLVSVIGNTSRPYSSSTDAFHAAI